MEDYDDEFDFQRASFFNDSLYGEWSEEAECDYAERASDINREFGL